MTEVYIARVDVLQDAALFAARYASLPAERKAKVDALRSEQDKRLSLGAWLLLAYALQKKGIAAPRLAYSENGKPYLADHADVHFNLSHSGEAVMCAVSDSAVGCDIQEICNVDTAMAKRFFHPEEQARLAAAPVEEQRTLFCRIWAAKESFVKLLGSGISRGMRDFSVDFAGAPCIRGEKTYYIKEVGSDGYAACVCSVDAETHMHIVELF